MSQSYSRKTIKRIFKDTPQLILKADLGYNA